MLVISDDMDAAMASHGFSRKKARWRRDSPDLPVVVYQEQPKTGGPRYGFTILYGFPHRDPEEWGCFQISQGEACGRHGHYYDVSAPRGREQIEQDFLAFTAPVAGQFHTGHDLAAALIQGQIPSSAPGRGATGLVKDVLDIADAHGLVDARDYALTVARSLDAAQDTREEVRELARFRPDVAEAIGWTPTPPPALRRRQWWRAGS
jgi:hypothetical protein